MTNVEQLMFADEAMGDANPLDTLLPLHFRAIRPGRVIHTGPTLTKLLPMRRLYGQDLFDVITFQRPEGLTDWDGLVAEAGKPLKLTISQIPGFTFRGVVAVEDAGESCIFDLSLGVGACDMVTQNALKLGDFSPADNTADLIYMVEAQAILLGASRDLNNRLDGAKTLAEEQAFTDSLTGLNNRRALRGFVERLLTRRNQPPFALMQVDLDFFKSVNDRHGHAAGDHTLKEVASILLSATRSTDMVARTGGDEFVIVLSDFGTAEDLQDIAWRIIEGVAQPISFGSTHLQIGASVGSTVCRDPIGVDADALLREADQALYDVKTAGRGGYQRFDRAAGGSA